jgi:hypothetical protein
LAYNLLIGDHACLRKRIYKKQWYKAQGPRYKEKPIKAYFFAVIALSLKPCALRLDYLHDWRLNKTDY